MPPLGVLWHSQLQRDPWSLRPSGAVWWSAGHAWQLLVQNLVPMACPDSRIHGMVIHGLSMTYPWVIHGKGGYPGGGTRMVNFVFKPCQSWLWLRLAMTKSCQIHVSASRGDNAWWCRYRNFIVFLRWYLLYVAGLNEEPCQLSTFILRSSHSSPWMPLIECRYSVIFKT